MAMAGNFVNERKQCTQVLGLRVDPFMPLIHNSSAASLPFAGRSSHAYVVGRQTRTRQT